LQADLSSRAGIGPVLRRAREARGVSLDAVSRSTRIRPRYLAALEDDAGSDAFPGPVYARFFLKEYARFLGVPDEPLVTALEERTAPPPPALRVVAELEPPRRWVGHLIRFLGAAFLVGLLAYTVAASSTDTASPTQSVRSRLIEVPRFVHRPNAGVGTPHPDIPIRGVLLVRAPTHVQVFVNGEKAVKRIVQPRRFVFRGIASAPGQPSLDLEVANGSAVKLVVNGHVVPTANRIDFHARFVSSFGRMVRL
jgi:transcriptional regulator with XRE-family HTH domain